MEHLESCSLEFRFALDLAYVFCFTAGSSDVVLMHSPQVKSKHKNFVKIEDTE